MKFQKLYCLVLILTASCSTKISSEASVPPVTSEEKTATVSDRVPNIPACLQQKIDSIKAMPVWNPPAEIHQYEYQGKEVYVLSAPCCDFFNTAVDKDCNYLCAPSGGFTGRGDGKCTDFFKTGKHIRLVWKDDRARR